MKILAIETSCDETAICLIEASGTQDREFRGAILGDALVSQAATHAEFGGVFPNVAKREHQIALVPLLRHVLIEAKLLKSGKSDISHLPRILEREGALRRELEEFLINAENPAIDAIAVTHGPGLEPALWVGINFARALSVSWNIPLVAVNHMEGHLLMPLFDVGTPQHHSNILPPSPPLRRTGKNIGIKMRHVDFPLLALLISGGHTELVLSERIGMYEILGRTRDDAVGEAYDKVARLLGLPYPGGPEISRLSEEAREEHEASLHGVSLPRPMINDPSLDFSFAGLKTAVRRIVERSAPKEADVKAIAREFEDAVAEVLVKKTVRALEERGAQSVAIGGGVSSNTNTRRELAKALESMNVPLFAPPPELATDNALMIALAGYFRARQQQFADAETLHADGNLSL